MEKYIKYTTADDVYLRGLARKTVDDVLNYLCQVAALLSHANQEVMQLLTPAKHEHLWIQTVRKCVFLW